LREERRRYSPRPDGREVLAPIDAAHREGIKAYLDGLDAGDRKWLDEAIRMSARTNTPLYRPTRGFDRRDAKGSAAPLAP